MQHNSAISITTMLLAAEGFSWKEYYPMSRHNGAASRHSKGRPTTGKRANAKRHLDRCPDSNKVRFRDKREALAALHSASNSRKYAVASGVATARHECRTYSCPGCHGWHLTSQESWGASSEEYRGIVNSSGIVVDRTSGPRRVHLAIRRTTAVSNATDADLSSPMSSSDWPSEPGHNAGGTR